SDARSVELIEVGPRDGLQNEARPVSLDDKLALINRLVEAGFRRIEATSFVSPTAIPQLADADDLMPGLPKHLDVDYICLVPNTRGYDRAMVAGVRHVEVFTAATDTFCQANTRCTIDESFERFAPIMERATVDSVTVRGAVSVAFHCPYSGPVEPEAAVAVAERLLAIGCSEVSIADTIGRASPGEVERLLELALRRLPTDRVAMHFHDTTGQAIENIRVSWDAGISRFDSSVGGLGGCPFAPGAPGNVASESVVHAFEKMNVSTGIDLDSLTATATWIRNVLGKDEHAPH
ncbi:MAG TPA: hydroxymethylglutaryl-CoA lyase, partial [Thermomicrobiales bacterium]|nr:hydroxymethylglutaryl-CoA lyase [Thermomicrobiales bacterium]